MAIGINITDRFILNTNKPSAGKKKEWDTWRKQSKQHIIPNRCPCTHTSTHRNRNRILFHSIDIISHWLRLPLLFHEQQQVWCAWKHAFPFRFSHWICTWFIWNKMASDTILMPMPKPKLKPMYTVYVSMPEHDLNQCTQIYHLHVQKFITNNHSCCESKLFQSNIPNRTWANICALIHTSTQGISVALL